MHHNDTKTNLLRSGGFDIFSSGRASVASALTPPSEMLSSLSSTNIAALTPSALSPSRWGFSMKRISFQPQGFQLQHKEVILLWA